MKLKEIAQKISQHAAVTIKAGTVVLANRIKTNTLGTEADIERYLIDLLKNGANPNAQVEVELRASNGPNATIYKDRVYLDKDEMPTTAAPSTLMMPTANATGNDFIYQFQIQHLTTQLAEAKDKIKTLTRENDDFYDKNRKMQVQLDTIDAKRQMETTLGEIEQKTSLTGVFDKLLEAGVINTLIEKMGSGGSKPAGDGQVDSEVAAVIASLIGHLPIEHQQYIVGIVKIYASAEPADAKQLLDLLTKQNGGNPQAKVA